jgi:hypothetical protein
MYIGLQVKYRLLLSGFNETRTVSTDFRKTLKYKFSRKSVHSFHEDRRMDGQT